LTTEDSTAIAPAEPPAVAVRPTRSLRSRLPEETGVVVALLVLVGFIGITNPAFLQPKSLFQLLANGAFTGMLALGMVFVVVIRDIDLSIGWMFNFSAVIAAKAMVMGVDPLIAAFIGIGFGACLGLVNGVLAVGLRIPVIIITLGTLSVYRGLSLVVNESKAVVPPDRELPYFDFWSSKLFDVIPMVAVAFVILAIVLHVLLQHSRFGYRVQAMGSNPDAARLAGIPVDRTRIAVLVLMGAISGLAGAIFLGFRGAIDPTTGDTYLLPVVAAVIIGGTALSGGRGTILGAVLGALIIQTIQSGILFLGIDAKWSIFVTGAVIIVAVAVDQIVRRQRTRRARDTVDAG
jgi:ribose/xylose/arabinose/galactoside ABC-type transport system permease subunit